MSKIYRINEFAKRIGKSTSTLRRWDTDGILVAKRMPLGHRYYDESDVRKLFGFKNGDKKNVVYCRVSSSGQKDDLSSQILAMESFGGSTESHKALTASKASSKRSFPFCKRSFNRPSTSALSYFLYFFGTFLL